MAAPARRLGGGGDAGSAGGRRALLREPGRPAQRRRLERARLGGGARDGGAGRRVRRAWIIEPVTLLVHDDRFSAPSFEFDQRVIDVAQRIAADPRLQVRSQLGWSSHPSPQRDQFLGKDGRTTLTTFELGVGDGTAKRILPKIERDLARFEADGLQVHLVGQAAAFGAVNEVGAPGLTRAEMILLPLVLAILMILYRCIAAALISLVVSVTAIVISMGALTWLAGV